MSKTVKAKVFVAMSGGVDSAVAAALLKKQSYDIVGVFIKIAGFTPSGVEGCDWREERRDALRAAAALEIPFLTLDLSAEYRRLVVAYLVREYAAGRTPNPDVMCNKEIKFGAFFNEARRRGADLIATGHYVRLRRGATFPVDGHNGKSTIKVAPRLRLVTARDKTKDQTYFLWSIEPAVLKHCLFPIGDYEKSQVRRLARKFGLPNAAKPDSQGLCFLGSIDFKDWLAEFLPEKPGPVLNDQGEIIGEHRGVHFYTIGERHGFEIHRRRTSSVEKADTLPHYIVVKDPILNTLTVAAKPQQSDWSVREISLAEPNWLSGLPDEGKVYRARLRYRAPLAACRLVLNDGDRWHLVFEKPQSSIAPGQSAVIYDRGVCLGGGVMC